MAKNKPQHLVDVSDVWPQERDFIERPERFKYVRKLAKPTGCVFCQTSKSKPSAKSLLLYKGKHAMVVLNKFPYNNGHLLVLPTRHNGDLLALKKTEYKELMELLKTSVAILKAVYKTENFNIGMNHGAVAGAGIPEHLHWHIVPRWFGDTNFFPLIAETKVLPQSNAEVFKALRPHFKKLEKS